MVWDFILTGWRRSGTTLLSSLLDSHPSIVCDNDSFNFFFSGDRYFEFLSRGGLGPARRENGFLYGLKTLDPFLVPSFKHPAIEKSIRRSGLETAIPAFDDYSDLVAQFTQALVGSSPKVINVVRHALFVYVSEQIALQRREFRYSSPFSERFALVFDMDHFRRWFAVKRSIESRVAFLKQPARTIHVFYEDLTSAKRRDAILRRIWRFLGVENLPVWSGLPKQLPTDLHDCVINYDEMLAQLRASELAFLAEQTPSLDVEVERGQ